jgi:hypothetical protein
MVISVNKVTITIMDSTTTMETKITEADSKEITKEVVVVKVIVEAEEDGKVARITIEVALVTKMISSRIMDISSNNNKV